MKAAKLILNIIIWIFLLGILAAPLVGIRPYVVRSGSMEPEIKTGSVVFVNERADYNELDPGDIIVFENGGTKVTHRILSIQADGIETKGDNNNTTDGITTTKNNFTGKVFYWIPGIGFLLDGKRKWLFAAAVFLIYLVVSGIAEGRSEPAEEGGKC
ncbi:signal peptidase I [Sellimonas intestinalis]|uniref:signal peptidase I n=1 Tax=Sellimonas intestinalis TaxID=1653434 RepID=UPI003AB39DAC